MRRTFVFSLLALVFAGGIASADNHRHNQRSWNNARGGVHVQRSYPRQSYRPAYRPTYRSSYRSPTVRVHVQPRVRVVRRPIYVQRPVIRYRYYNYYQRPAVIVENQPPMPGYYWVAGQWQWNGYEWIWQAGHYEPDPNYVDPSYGYDQAPGTYYDGSY
jgi:hypothetical protein